MSALRQELRPREIQVLNSAAYSRQKFGIENYLCTPGQTKAAERMIARGFLTEVERLGFGGWGLVVKLTDENIAAIKAERLTAVKARIGK